MAARELDSLHSFPDRAIRESLRHPDNLRELVEAVAPDLAAGFDFARAELLDRSSPWTTGGGASRTSCSGCLIAGKEPMSRRWSVC